MLDAGLKREFPNAGAVGGHGFAPDEAGDLEQWVFVRACGGGTDGSGLPVGHGVVIDNEAELSWEGEEVASCLRRF